jgi:hypothetical protein
MIREYKPFRVMHKFSVPSTDLKKIERDYPNGIISQNGKMYFANYKTHMIINRPSESEISLFAIKRDKIPFALEIPQDIRGFDLRTSGLARSVKSSKEAREKALVDIAREKHMAGFKESVNTNSLLSIKELSEAENVVYLNKEDDVKKLEVGAMTDEEIKEKWKSPKREKKSKKSIPSDEGYEIKNLDSEER